MSEKVYGSVRRWCGEYGFVSGDDGGEFFLHINELAKSKMAMPRPGDRLRFTPEPGKRGMRAVAVEAA
jgi:cold shock CspA family protein